jgi:hypothetical protein
MECNPYFTKQTKKKVHKFYFQEHPLGCAKQLTRDTDHYWKINASQQKRDYSNQIILGH